MGISFSEYGEGKIQVKPNPPQRHPEVDQELEAEKEGSGALPNMAYVLMCSSLKEKHIKYALHQRLQYFH